MTVPASPVPSADLAGSLAASSGSGDVVAGRPARSAVRARRAVVRVLGLGLAVGLGLGLALVGCGGEEQAPPLTPPAATVGFAGCAALTAAPAQARPGTTGAPAGEPLPRLTLPCYTGGGVDLAALRGPAVVNLWASWCPPCRRELPVLERFARRHAGAVHVVGVVSEDAREPAAALATDLGLGFPHLYDREGALMRAMRRGALPVTLFVDGQGRVREVYSGRALDGPLLDRLAREQLGVVPA
jgi:thiol-disulfide isomerase/thioredoxin